MTTFLVAVNRAKDDHSGWDEAIACLDLSKVNADRGRELATKLLGITNRLGKVAPELMPDAAEVRRAGISSYTYFPRGFEHNWVRFKADPKGSIELARGDDGAWRFSAQTVAGLDALYDSLKHLPILYGVDERGLSLPLWIESKVPKVLRTNGFLTLKYWQWAGLAILILLGTVLEYTVRFFLRITANRIAAKYKTIIAEDTVTGAIRPLGLLAAGLFWLLAVRVLGLPDGALTVLLTAARVFVILAGTLAAWRLADLLAEALAYKAGQTATKFDDVLIPLLRKATKIFVSVFALIYGAGALNIPLMPMLTSLGIGGLAFAFAAKDTVENFFGSVAVILDRPFEVGDWVVIGDVEGTVEEVGFRSTRVRTFYNSQVTVPNAALVRATVDNYGRRRYRRVKTHIGVQYDTPPEKIIAFTEGIRELVRSHPYTRKDYFQVYFNQFGPSSLDILLYVFHETPDWSTELRERERLFLDIVRLADQLGVSFAFPTQTVHLYKEEAGVPHEPMAVPDGSVGQKATHEGIRIAQELMRDQPWTKQVPGPVEFAGGPTRLDIDEDTDQTDQRVAGG